MGLTSYAAVRKAPRLAASNITACMTKCVSLPSTAIIHCSSMLSLSLACFHLPHYSSTLLKQRRRTLNLYLKTCGIACFYNIKYSAHTSTCPQAGTRYHSMLRVGYWNSMAKFYRQAAPVLPLPSVLFRHFCVCLSYFQGWHWWQPLRTSSLGPCFCQ